jgi:hypothetical protein
MEYQTDGYGWHALCKASRVNRITSLKKEPANEDG